MNNNIFIINGILLKILKNNRIVWKVKMFEETFLIMFFTVLNFSSCFQK